MISILLSAISHAMMSANATASHFKTARPLRVLQVFNRYLQPGGEENSVARIAAHLELAGHWVERFWRASEEWTRPGAPPKWRQPFLLLNNPAVLAELRAAHERFQPDVWLFHNLVPVISLGAYRLARDLGAPVINWLHNYRPISPSGTLRAGNRPLAPDDPLLVWKEIVAGSWHGRFLTAWLANGYAKLKRSGCLEHVKAWVALSEAMKTTFVRGGFPAEKIQLLRHSWDVQPALVMPDKGYFLFLGRMVEEKGVKFLLELWQQPEFSEMLLVLAGDGPLADAHRLRTPPNVRWVGFVRGEEKRRLVAGCRAVLSPGLWNEPLSTVVYEAFEQCRPFIASNLGGPCELVTDGKTGRLLPPGNAGVWSAVLQQLYREPDTCRMLGEAGRAWLEANISPAVWNRQFDDIVQQVLR